MEENKVVEQFAEVAKEAGCQVIDMPPVPAAKGMNYVVTFSAAGVGLASGIILMWVGPKVVRGIKGLFTKKAKVESEDTGKAEANADEK